jgi:hypothetical protein
MNTKPLKKSKRFQTDAGVALLTTLLLLFLMSSLLVGFSILLISNQQLAGSNNDDVTAFYSAEAGLEQMTSNLGDLFAQTYSPTGTQINNIALNPPLIPGIQFVESNGTSGYTIAAGAYDSNGNPAPTISTIKSGTYAGMTALLTEYTMVVNARTTAGREVKLQRTTQTVGIPMFQFGIFSDTDLSFFPGPNFNFGGRTHTNGNLFLASGSTLTLSDKVDAYKDVIRTNLENGWPTSTNYTGTVQITTQPGGSNYRSLGMSEGSLTGTVGSPANSAWPTISLGSAPTDYNGNLLNGRTGGKQLNLGIVTIGNGATEPIDLIRRPISGESSSVTGERYFAQASLKILLSDNPQDIMNLPCIDGGTQPFDLSTMAQPVANWTGTAATLAAKMTANGVTPLPLAASGAASNLSTGGAYNSADGYWTPNTQGALGLNTWPVIKGYIKIEEQLAYGSPCGTWKDVTVEVLSYGYVGRNINPVSQSLDGVHLNPQWVQNTTTMQAGAAPNLPYRLPVTPTYAPSTPSSVALSSQFPPTPSFFPAGNFTAISQASANPAYTCMDPHPYAVIRLERIRDNPSSVAVTTGNITLHSPSISTVAQVCGVDPSSGNVGKLATGWVPQTYDFWPNVLFDTREGTLRDVSMSTTNLPTLNGVMHYIEIDGKNLANWFGGKIGTITTSGQLTKDPAVAPNNFVVYVSDRRGNYAGSATLTGGWPPLSYTHNETGESGWTDLVNSPQNPTTGCPNNSLDTGEDENANTAFAGQGYTYGAAQQWIHAVGALNTTGSPLGLGQIGVFANLVGTGVTGNSVCTTPPSYVTDNIWPMSVATNPIAARENAPLFFRRAVKVVNGNLLTAVGPCPGGNNCGLTIATENPAYIQGDFNANVGGNGWSDPSIAASVAADAVTLLSDQWNDVNSFSSPYATTLRNGNTTWYRIAVIGGATNYFPQPSGSGIGQDYGTDGGVHNFLRYIEAWGGTLEYEGSIIDLFYSRQANSTFKCCNTVYSPPTRGYNFDTNFLTPALLPPRTPLFRDVNTTGWTRLLTPNSTLNQ